MTELVWTQEPPQFKGQNPEYTAVGDHMTYRIIVSQTGPSDSVGIYQRPTHSAHPLNSVEYFAEERHHYFYGYGPAKLLEKAKAYAQRWESEAVRREHLSLRPQLDHAHSAVLGASSRLMEAIRVIDPTDPAWASTVAIIEQAQEALDRAGSRITQSALQARHARDLQIERVQFHPGDHKPQIAYVRRNGQTVRLTP